MWESDRGGVTLTAISETSNDARNSVLGWRAVGWLEAEVQQCGYSDELRRVVVKERRGGNFEGSTQFLNWKCIELSITSSDNVIPPAPILISGNLLIVRSSVQLRTVRRPLLTTKMFRKRSKLPDVWAFIAVSPCWAVCPFAICSRASPNCCTAFALWARARITSG
jgi:hypothetical protein